MPFILITAARSYKSIAATSDRLVNGMNFIILSDKISKIPPKIRTNAGRALILLDINRWVESNLFIVFHTQRYRSKDQSQICLCLKLSVS